MEKKIQDYLHLYVGQTLYTGTGRVILVAVQVEVTPCTNFRVIVLNGNQVHEASRPEELKLFLRPLSSMMDSEAIELARLVAVEDQFTNVHIWPNQFGDKLVRWDTDSFNATAEKTWSSEQFMFLLSLGFDLFDLIPSGLAIDKTIHLQ